jgi:hypothetical protein
LKAAITTPTGGRKLSDARSSDAGSPPDTTATFPKNLLSLNRSF